MGRVGGISPRRGSSENSQGSRNTSSVIPASKPVEEAANRHQATVGGFFCATWTEIEGRQALKTLVSSVGGWKKWQLAPLVVQSHAGPGAGSCSLAVRATVFRLGFETLVSKVTPVSTSRLPAGELISCSLSCWCCHQDDSGGGGWCTCLCWGSLWELGMQEGHSETGCWERLASLSSDILSH